MKEDSEEPAAKRLCQSWDETQLGATKEESVQRVPPAVQFGTYKMKGEECYRSVLAALKVKD